MKKPSANILIHTATTLLLFFIFLGIYRVSVPDKFNVKYENRKYFDSDGEFIVRQFRQGKTFTHNDHLLYHLLAKGLYSLKQNEDYVTPHKTLSVFFGALGVTLFYVMGVMITGRFAVPLLCALFAAGTAGWWFFSATIDTYIPCLSVSVPVLGLAVLSLRKDTLYRSMALGALAGLAFLFRTDSFLLALMGICLIRNRKKLLANTLSAVLPGIAVGIIGYAILAIVFYDIEFKDLTAFLGGSLNRPESADKDIWGTVSNMTPYNAAVVLVNQLLYTIVLPGLQETRRADFYVRYVKGGWIPLLIYFSVLVTALSHLGKRVMASRTDVDREPMYVALLAGIWFFSRMIFYTWWDPFDPFLFAVMSLPAIWLVILAGFHYALDNNVSRKTEIVYTGALCIMALATWLHNIYYMVNPLRGIGC